MVTGIALPFPAEIPCIGTAKEAAAALTASSEGGQCLEQDKVLQLGGPAKSDVHPQPVVLPEKRLSQAAEKVRLRAIAQQETAERKKLVLGKTYRA